MCCFAYLREAQNVFDDVIGARLKTVRAALNTVSDVLGLALDCAAISPQGGCAASLEPVELLTGQSAVAVGADGRGYAVTRLEHRPNRDQDDRAQPGGRRPRSESSRPRRDERWPDLPAWRPCGLRDRCSGRTLWCGERTPWRSRCSVLRSFAFVWRRPSWRLPDVGFGSAGPLDSVPFVGVIERK